MRAAELSSVGTVSIIEVAEPRLLRTDVLVEVRAAGVCGSDLQALKGTHPGRKPPMILGHEVAGIVIEVGADVSKISVGDTVTILTQVFCGKCSSCARGIPRLCSSRTTPGGPDWSGTFVERFAAPEHTVFRVPNEVSFRLALLAEPLAVAMHATRMADAASGTSVLVIGGGPIGALAAVVLIEAGVRVMVSEPNPARRSRLSSRGAHAVAPDQVAAAIALSGAFDSVICTVGSEAAMGQAVSGVQPGGRIVAVGVFGGMTAIDLNAVQTREIHLVGSMIYDRQDFHDSLAMLQRNVDLESFVTHVLPLEGVVTALTLAGSLDADVMKVAIDPSCSDMT